MLTSIVGHIAGGRKGQCDEQRDWERRPAERAEVKAKIQAHLGEIFTFLEVPDETRRFEEVERRLRGLVLALARLLLLYFLALRHERSEREVRQCLRPGFRERSTPELKILNTFFGKVFFWRAAVRRPGGSGFHPLDMNLGLTADGFSLATIEMSARLSTLVSYDQVTALSLYFTGWSPSKTTVEKAVLGLGRFTEEWFARAPAPKGDGEVLIIQVDCKAAPTASEEELEKRRGKRQESLRPLSPRHRGRANRRRRGTRKRKAPGDKTKNGKAVTLLTMYTLKESVDENGKPVLLGPINKWVYASFGPKVRAFEIARREADKRGFVQGSGKDVQILTDGDDDLEIYAKRFFPEAKHTLDIMHVLEYLWEAARLVFDGQAVVSWVKRQEQLLYRGKPVLVVEHVQNLVRTAAPGVQKRLAEIQNYLVKRVRMMDYRALREADLEVASGAVEGAVRHVVAKRFDNGGMRWIVERAQPLLQLRCIEINGQWSAFIAFVARRLREKTKATGCPARLLTTKPAPLPACKPNS